MPPLRGVTAGGEEATVAGRICGEVDGKLNAKSIFIEGSRGLSNGFRVRLDLSQCSHYAVFPVRVRARVRVRVRVRVSIRVRVGLGSGYDQG